MNETIKTLMAHRSHRSYLDKDLDETALDMIIKAVQAAPSWINGQQVSIIAIRDPEQKRKFADLCGGQKHIEEAPVFLVFCLDFYRAYLASELENTPFAVSGNIDTLMVGSTDVGIALGTAIAAAESLGLGTVAIGGIRRNLQETIRELNLPPYVFPVSGLCIGHPASDPGLKPRLPKQAVFHESTYNRELLPLIEEYNEVYANYVHERSKGKQSAKWTEGIANFYSREYYQGVGEALKKQRFLKEDED